jgi:hypothetical protein
VIFSQRLARPKNGKKNKNPDPSNAHVEYLGGGENDKGA